MTQPSKKPTPQPAAKLASSMANKATKDTMAAFESTRSSTENVVKIGGKAVKDFMSTSSDEMQKTHEKIYAIGREGAEHLAKSADAVSKVLYETISISRDNIETCIECGNLTAALAKDISGEIFETANKAFSDNMEMSKEFFACRTFNDMFDLQNKLMKKNIDAFFNESLKLSNMVFEYSTEALEPINERVAQASEQMSKVLAP